MPAISELLENNRRWAQGITEQDSGFFERLARGQTPEILWIGCADSRVPANQVLGLDPGKVFVHRNIANRNSIRVYHGYVGLYLPRLGIC